jgi:hypothetical protein
MQRFGSHLECVRGFHRNSVIRRQVPRARSTRAARFRLDVRTTPLQPHAALHACATTGEAVTGVMVRGSHRKHESQRSRVDGSCDGGLKRKGSSGATCASGGDRIGRAYERCDISSGVARAVRVRKLVRSMDAAVYFFFARFRRIASCVRYSPMGRAGVPQNTTPFPRRVVRDPGDHNRRNQQRSLRPPSVGRTS